MAKYNIKALNYIACGSARSFINMDVELGYELYDYVHLLCAEAGSGGYPDQKSWRAGTMSSDISVDIGTEHGEGEYYPTDFIYRERNLPLSRENESPGIVLNEQQRYFNEADSSKRKYIRLYLSCCTNQLSGEILQFNKNREMPNMTYLLENTPNNRNNLTCDGVKIRNAYDISDVSIRRLGRHESKNQALGCHDRMYPHGESYAATHHDVYAPAMASRPVGFCQSNTQTDFKQDAIIMTSPATSMPQYFESDMEGHRYDDIRQHFDLSVLQQGARAYTYRPADGETAASAFIPYRSFNGINRQFLLDMPVDNDFSQNSITSDYDSGEIYYRRMMTAKSLYGSQYSMEMPSEWKLSSARTYCGIGTCAGRTYLKYWDDIDYNVVSTDRDYLTECTAESANSYDGSRYSDIKPYQKIEYLYPTDYSSSAKHKSNMFSIEILSTGIGSMEERELAVLEDLDATDADRSAAADALRKLDILKRDIAAAVREIVRNITPANTQLFDVYFNDN